MYNLLCDWYTIGLVLYVTIVFFFCVLGLLIYKFGSGNEFNSALLCCAGWFLALADFAWGIINCFIEGKLPIGIFVITMGIWVLVTNIIGMIRINKNLEDL